MSLVIERLRNRFHASSPLAAGQCQAWLEALAAADGEALVAGLAAPDEWLLIRHLPLALRWQHDAGDGEVVKQWSQALRRALEQALAHPEDGAVIRYASRHAAIADMLYRSALGETTRQWAWQRMGLIPHHGLSPSEVLQHGVIVLLRETELVWPVLHGLIAGEGATASLTALLRRLQASDWHALLQASPRTAAYARLLAGPTAAAPAAQAAPPDAAVPASPIAARPADFLLAGGGTLRALLEWAAARRHFAVRHLEVLTVLATALAWPATGASPALQQARLLAAQAHLRSSVGGPADTPIIPSATGTASPAETRPPVERAPDLLPLPALPEEIEWLPTHWAGALFWLARLPAGGLLDWQAGQDVISLPLVLRAVGSALGVPDEDPALRAFCGGTVPPGEVPAAARERATEQVLLWSAWLDEAAPELPAPRVDTVCRRGGRLRFEAGWIEVHLPLDSVDTSIRRLGLDLDPGWLPWLGCVVRITYDE